MRNFIKSLLVVSVGIALFTPPVEAKKPTVPTEFLAEKSQELPGAVELSWRPVKGISEYAISASRETSDNWQSLGTTTGANFQVNELPEGTKYYFRIASKDRAGQSEWSDTVVQYSSRRNEFRPAPLLPASLRVSEQLTVGNVAAPGPRGELLLAWGAVAGAKSYVVQMCEARQCGDSPGEAGRSGRSSQDEYFRDLVTVAGTEHLAKGLSSGKVYHFRIMGLDNKGQRGGYSAVQSRSAP
jgi:hypothetical protein